MSIQTEQLRARLTPEQREAFDWAYAATATAPALGTILLGFMSMEASLHPEKSFWDLLIEAKGRVKLGIIH
jgi:hypothetical protein